MPNLNLHPKVRASAIASAAVAILAVIATAASYFPDNKWAVLVLGVVGLVLPVVAGYAKSSNPAAAEPVLPAVLFPGADQAPAAPDITPQPPEGQPADGNPPTGP